MSIEQAKAAIAAAVGQADEALELARGAGEPIDAAAGRVASATLGTSHHLPGEAISGLHSAKSMTEEGLGLLASGLRTAQQYVERGL